MTVRQVYSTALKIVIVAATLTFLAVIANIWMPNEWFVIRLLATGFVTIVASGAVAAFAWLGIEEEEYK